MKYETIVGVESKTFLNKESHSDNTICKDISSSNRHQFRNDPRITHLLSIPLKIDVEIFKIIALITFFTLHITVRLPWCQLLHKE